MQLELFPFEQLSDAEKQRIFGTILANYWPIRNLRKWRPNDAARRRAYRKIEAQKKRLLLAGVPKREILDFLACCRDKCKKGRNCPHCGGKFS